MGSIEVAVIEPEQIENRDPTRAAPISRRRAPEGAIVVTGASGLLGANLVLCAARQLRNVTAVSHRHGVNLRGVDCYQLDLADATAAMAVLKGTQPGSIVHCAAATDVDWCEDHPDQAAKINVEAPGWLAKFAFQRNVPFVYISTDAVFDGARSCYSEVDEPNPTNVYASSKLQGEREVLSRNPNAIVARVALYGWSAKRKPSLAEWVFGSLTAGRSVPGFSDVYFCPILVNDVCDVILAMLDRRLSGLFHVVGSQRISKYEFARSVARAFGLPEDRVLCAKISESDLRARRPLDTSLDTGKVATALGRKMLDVESGLRRFRDLYESGYPQILQGLVTGETG